ncbi:hypothetical protein B5X24_HaOG205899 [Helicoverpa armigera]|uniref:Uncharacterized protein n=1 Tax=Helicoverpa armigera TaxID=29058 RepID=A0A2W1BV42_HELAM|nr:hypothetical protein B5X24_HaOG205899 [Helicoverpa armigera]
MQVEDFGLSVICLKNLLKIVVNECSTLHVAGGLCPAVGRKMAGSDNSTNILMNKCIYTPINYNAKKFAKHKEFHLMQLDVLTKSPKEKCFIKDKNLKLSRNYVAVQKES